VPSVTTILDGVLASLLGVLVAMAELVSRYRDDPARAVWSIPAAVYVGVNALGALAAFALIRIFGWTFGASVETLRITQILVAGLASAALFRSSLFNVTAGDQTLGIGPSAILTVILNAADRAVDRQRARVRSEQASSTMEKVSFKLAADILPMYCFAAMQNASSNDVKVVEDQILKLRDSRYISVPDRVKAYVLGLTLLSIVGRRVLQESVDQLMSDIQRMEETGSFANKSQTTATTPDGRDGTHSKAREALDEALDMVKALPPDGRSVLLQILAEAQNPIELKELQAKSGLPFLDFTNLLTELKNGRKVNIEGDPGKEKVSLIKASS
jgi:hypothetical protein